MKYVCLSRNPKVATDVKEQTWLPNEKYYEWQKKLHMHLPKKKKKK